MSLIEASTSALLVMALPMPTSPSSLRTSMIVLISSSGFRSSTQPPSTVPPDRPVMRTSWMSTKHLTHSCPESLLDHLLLQDLDSLEHLLILASGQHIGG